MFELEIPNLAGDSLEHLKTKIAADKGTKIMRFPVYESLYFFNRNVQDILIILDEIKKAPGMPQKSLESYKVEIQYLRSHATQDVLEVMNDTEIHEMAKLGKQKKAYDDSIRDLDDVYFEVQHREEERHKQGLPPLLGILPFTDQGPIPTLTSRPDEDSAKHASSEEDHSKGRNKSRSRRALGKYRRNNPRRKSSHRRVRRPARTNKR